MADNETKQTFRTTGFWAFAAVLVSLVLAGDATGGRDDPFRADRLWLYVAILAAGFLISRGLSKASSSLVAENAPEGGVARAAVPLPVAVAGDQRTSQERDDVRGSHATPRSSAPGGPAGTGSFRRAASHPEPPPVARGTRDSADPIDRIQIFAARSIKIIRRTLLAATILFVMVVALIAWLIIRLF